MLQIAKYIENKKIDTNKSNNVPELRGVGESAWKLISAIYSSGWDSLFADKNNNTFRQKVSFKYTPNVNPLKNGKKGKKNTDKPASIERLPSPISAKLPKEVKEISKFFKKTSPANRNKNNRKSYVQAENNTREVLKIKEVFLNLQAKKIENIQKIIKDNSKAKLKLNMTIKRPSRKQIIILINSNNKMKFIVDSSSYVTNLNKTLKNIKSDIMVNFVQQEQLEIIIVTNKVVLPLDL